MIHLYLHAQYFQQKVEDMYKILVGISRELANIKQIMAEEGNISPSLFITNKNKKRQ